MHLFIFWNSKILSFSKLNFFGDAWKQYHGGTNFGRTAGGPFITTSYDYDAPLDEYGKNKNSQAYNFFSFYKKKI